MNRKDKIKELENTLDKCIKDLEALKQPEFKDGDSVRVSNYNIETNHIRVFKEYKDGLFYTYLSELGDEQCWEQCKPFK